jgi:hypothetical protein
MPRRFTIYPLLFAAAFLLMGCTGSTEIARSWKNPEYTAKPFRSLLVVAISKDAIARGTVEGDVVKELEAQNISARMGIELFPPLLFKETISKEAARQKVIESGADAVLLITPLSDQKTETYVPGAMVYTPSAGSVAMYGYWYDTWNMAYTQGAYISSRQVVLQSNLYRAADEALLWEARSEITDPSSLSKSARTYAKVLVAKMFSDGALAAPSGGKAN